MSTGTVVYLIMFGYMVAFASASFWVQNVLVVHKLVLECIPTATDDVELAHFFVEASSSCGTVEGK